MKKLTAMLLSLVMCFSLMAVTAQAAIEPQPAGPVIIDVTGPKDPAKPGDKDPEEPENGIQNHKSLPGDLDDIPIDD